jgi:hypothetical protein
MTALDTHLAQIRTAQNLERLSDRDLRSAG